MSNNRILDNLENRDLIGPGVWFMLHIIGLHANSNKTLRDAYPEIINVLREKFPCEECRQHFNKMSDALRIDDFLKQEHGAFNWSYVAHKTVNERLGKITPEYAAAMKFFLNPGGNCANCSVKKKRGFNA